ncbi:hypothetical protein [Aromatoleum diolicum]|uniref:Cytochrome c domain-containing protein n=1 Tax=Aromatoleum diolicum TaxID=75796 RepID=A0ABX1QFY0_9RHOO|nr:hypothetical protein [Aromatoleum diolicum]NMG77304.1 hypothetical protein [Aromatoleum diolicum]
MLHKSMLVVPFIFFGNPADAGEQAVRDASRGELLYATHCESCHNIEVHWRNKHVVTDWASLGLQVRYWQGVAGLGWNNEDIAEVARYLNTLHYRYSAPD